MANPIILIALLAGGALLLMKKPTPSGAAKVPNTLPPAQPGSQTVQVPNVQLPGVSPENQPTVTVTVPPAYATPGIAQKVPVGVAKFPDVPGAATVPSPAVVHATGDLPWEPTPQQVITHTLPSLAKEAAQVLNPPTVVQAEESKPALDPYGTVELAARMINAESASGWKTALASDIKFWQSKVGLTQDGKFGPNSASKMAEEVGVLPLIRYFPASSSSKAAALKSYRDRIYTMAANADNKNPAQGAALRSSAAYEQGQGWAASPAPVPATARVAQAAALSAALKG